MSEIESAEQFAERRESGNEWLRQVAGEARRSLRSVLRARGFALLAIGTLALGIAACTAIYALADAVLLRALPFPQSGRVVALLQTSRRFPRMSLDWPDYLDWKASNRVFSQLAATRGSDMTLDHLGPATMVIGNRVTANYFALLGVRPELGRTFTVGEDSAAGPNVVVVSDAFYRSRLGGDRQWLGRALDLDGVARTVVGVMPPGFPGTDSAANLPQFWTPLGEYAAVEGRALMARRGQHSLVLVGRLRTGVTLGQARAEMSRISGALAAAYPATNSGVGARIVPYLDFLTGSTRLYLLPLLAAAFLLLLVACASVANLLVARGAARAREAAIRRALGASDGSLFRDGALEGLWLGAGGCGLGLALAWAALHALPAAALAQLPRADHAALQPGVAAVAAGLALGCSLLFALAPYWQTRRADVAGALRPASPGSVPRAARLRRAMILGEVALTTLLLIGGGLLARSLARLDQVEVGFQPQGVLSFIVGLADPRYATVARQQGFFRDAVERLQRLPGVEAAGGVFPLPLIGYTNETVVLIAGAPRAAHGHEPTTHEIAVRGDYFAAMGIPLLRGRLFRESDRAGSPPVALVDAVFARRYLDGAALGRQINLDGTLLDIVGEVGHVQDTAVADAPAPQLYVAQDQVPGRVAALSFVVKARSGGALDLRPAALAQIAALDPDQPVTDVDAMSALVAASTAPQRQMLQLVGAFAVLALVMALVGVYGLLAYTVVQRRREIGIRMALGASRWQVLTGVVAQGLRWAAVGAAVGLGLAFWLSRLAAGLLFGVAPRDPATFAIVPLILLAAVVLAGLGPALSACRTDPLNALRSE